MEREPKDKKPKESFSSQVADGVVTSLAPEVFNAAVDHVKNAIEVGADVVSKVIEQTEDVANDAGQKLSDVGQSAGEAIGKAVDATSNIDL